MNGNSEVQREAFLGSRKEPCWAVTRKKKKIAGEIRSLNPGLKETLSFIKQAVKLSWLAVTFH